MKKNLSVTLAIGTFILGINGVSSAAILTMTPGLITDYTDYDTRYEFEDYGAGGNVTVTGGPYGTSTDGTVLWILADNVTTTTNDYLTVSSGQDIYIQFRSSDWNDGIAKFETRLLATTTWVDHGMLPTNNGGNQYARLSGLTAGNYLLRITSFDQDDEELDDLHLDYYGTTYTIQSANLKSAKIVRDINDPDKDLAVFNMRDMTDLVVAAQGEPEEVTLWFGNADDCTAYEYTGPITNLTATKLSSYEASGPVFKVTCSLTNELCKVVVQNANFDENCTSEDMTVNLTVGATTYSHTGTWEHNASSTVDRYTYPVSMD